MVAPPGPKNNVSEAKDYKSTVNLPQTAFPMQANLARREPEMLARWDASDLYGRIQAATASGQDYHFVDGPPYANGDIHIGHAVNKVLKDIVVKSRRLDGRHAAFVPGWDCHGLPIELQVEKKFGKVGDRLDAATFRARCREYAAEQVARQREDFKRLGVLADWDRPYLTMDPAYEAEQLRVLARIVDNGHVMRGFKPVHWCLDCGSSLAEAEVEYQDKQSTAIDVRYAAADPAQLAARFGLADPVAADFVIWTTTPWTLPASCAIAINGELVYALVQMRQAGLVVLAEEMAERVAGRWDDEVVEVLARCAGTALEGAIAMHPFIERDIPVILGEHVTLEAGTGLVHTAPAHGVEDYVAARRYGIEVRNPVGANGVYVEGTPLVGGMFLRRAEAVIVDALRDRGRLARAETISHSYPHCWRHKTPLIFRATPQWFISMDERGLRGAAVKAIEQTHWIPGWGENRIREMVQNRPDWCISRQRYWGVPLAVFVDRQAQTLHPDSAALLRRVADRVEQRGLECWFASTPADWGVDETRYEKCPDTMDVWFDSGSAHQCSFKQTNPAALVDGIAPQADMYLEGSDQHRGWFQSSLLTSVAMYGRSPYRNVLTHGFTVDEQGRKMSKSLGNVVAPQQVTKTLGADVLRLWVSASDYSGEIAISDQLLQRMADAYRRIRNTVRYLLGNLFGFDPATDAVPVGEMIAIDRWAVAQAAQLQSEIQAAYASCEFHLVYQRLHNYCVVDLGGLYLDVLKDRLYTMPARSLGRRSAQTVLWHLAEAIVRWIAPVLSFTADEVWQLLPGDRSQPVFAQRWWAFPAVETGADAVDWPRLKATRDAVKKVLEELRVQGSIGSGLNAEVSLYADGELADALRMVAPELRFWFITSDARLGPVSGRPAEARSATLDSGETLWIAARPSSCDKCVRCWHQRADVGADPAHPQICGRCVINIEGAGETRRYI